MIDCVEQSYYQITDKNLLLQAYKEVFNIELCSTCTISPITAFNALRTYQLNMAKKKETKAQAPDIELKIKDEFRDATFTISGIGSIMLKDMSQEQIKKYILPYKGNHCLLA